MDTNEWSVDEIGIYTRLLFSEWINKDLPNEIVRLARIAGCGVKKFQKGWTTISFKFVPNGKGRLINLKMEEIREKQRKYLEKQKKSGKKGAEKRWKDYNNPNGNPNGEPIGEPNDQKMALQSSSSIIGNSDNSKAVHSNNTYSDNSENIGLSKKNSTGSKRKSITFPKEDYDLIIRSYENIKGIKLKGDEYKPIQQSIKTMLMSERTSEQIVEFMNILENSKEEWTQSWTIDTVRKKLPEFLAGKLKNLTIRPEIRNEAKECKKRNPGCRDPDKKSEVCDYCRTYLR